MEHMDKGHRLVVKKDAIQKGFLIDKKNMIDQTLHILILLTKFNIDNEDQL